MSIPATSSGSLAVGTNVVLADAGRLLGVTLVPAAAACSVIVYDNAATAAGTVVATVAGVANGATNTWDINAGIAINSGLVAVVAGTGATAILHYAQG